jgi:XRE family transcriptional regulator, regulator of sulfur utilization
MPRLSRRHAALGDAVRALRHERGLSQETLADAAGMSTNYVGDAERGERNISVRALWQLADGLGVPASELMGMAEKAILRSR